MTCLKTQIQRRAIYIYVMGSGKGKKEKESSFVDCSKPNVACQYHYRMPLLVYATSEGHAQKCHLLVKELTAMSTKALSSRSSGPANSNARPSWSTAVMHTSRSPCKSGGAYSSKLPPRDTAASTNSRSART